MSRRQFFTGCCLVLAAVVAGIGSAVDTGPPKHGWRPIRLGEYAMSEFVDGELYASPDGVRITDDLDLLEALGLHLKPPRCCAVFPPSSISQAIERWTGLRLEEESEVNYSHTGRTEQRGDIVWAEYRRSNE